MLSSDKTEVINFNWSFESIHANIAVGRRRNTAGAKPAGWYYEVQVMTQGIMQIGEFLIQPVAAKMSQDSFVVTRSTMK